MELDEFTAHLGYSLKNKPRFLDSVHLRLGKATMQLSSMISRKGFCLLLYIQSFMTTCMIQGAPKMIMIAFFALGALFVVFSLWALYLTDIPQEQFLEDPRFEEEYIKYYQWLALFGGVLVGIGWVFAFVGRQMTSRQRSRQH